MLAQYLSTTSKGETMNTKQLLTLFAVITTAFFCYSVSNVWKGEGGLISIFMLIFTSGGITALFFMGED